MAIPRMEEDVEIISKLGDVPGSDDGLSPNQLKNKFDLAAIRIKSFVNDTLLPELDKLVDVNALVNSIIDKTLTISDKAADAKVTGDELKKKLDTAGGTMTGAIDMGGKKVTNLATPEADSDAANKSFVTAYADGKRLHGTVTLTASGWSAAAPYTQTVSVAGILATDRPHYGVVYAAGLETALAQKEAFALVDDLDTAAGSVTFTCFEDKPEVDLIIQLEVNR